VHCFIFGLCLRRGIAMSAQTNELLVASESSDNEAVTHKSRARKLGFVGAGLLAAAGLVGIGYKLGASSTSVHADVAALEESLEISPPGKMCSKVNEECGGTKCCKLTGYKCYNKNHVQRLREGLPLQWSDTAATIRQVDLRPPGLLDPLEARGTGAVCLGSVSLLLRGLHDEPGPAQGTDARTRVG
jgi:hypothetical protein